MLVINAANLDTLFPRLLHLARIYDDGHDDLGSTGAVIRAVLAGEPVAAALDLDLADEFAKARFERAKP